MKREAPPDASLDPLPRLSCCPSALWLPTAAAGAMSLMAALVACPLCFDFGQCSDESFDPKLKQMLNCSTNHEIENEELPGPLRVFHTVRKPCGPKSYGPLCEVLDLDSSDPASGVKDWGACVPPSASRDSAEREVCCTSRHAGEAGHLERLTTAWLIFSSGRPQCVSRWCR